MSLVNEKKKGYNQLVLRSIAMVCTVLAIVSHTVAPTFRFFGYLEWVAFPIFAYLLAEGVENSMAKGLYAARLFLFALLAECPYDLMMSGKVMDIRQQNVLFTLSIGYLILLAVDFIRTHADNLILTIAAEVGGIFFGRYMISEIHCAYSRFGMFFIMLFYVARRVRYEKLMELAVTLYIAFNLSNQTFATPKINGLQYDLSVQLFAVVALILIWLYNGERGPNTLAVRYISYGFFPVSVLIFWYLSSQGVIY
ncbi:MAG: hypothetical protein J6A42_07460 [Firmicutes bacterium]|nr:hypothetical protein [Bacillota bacterium]